MAEKSKEQWQAEKLETLRYNRARIAARPNQDLWADQLAMYDAEIAATEAGNFFIPRTFQDQEAHASALRSARVAKAKELGAAAYAAGKPRVAGADNRLMAMYEPWVALDAAGMGASRHNIAMATAWLQGWDEANLAAPVEGV